MRASHLLLEMGTEEAIHPSVDVFLLDLEIFSPER